MRPGEVLITENSVNRIPVSTNDRELMALPSIASQMPVTFKSGARWDCLDGQCKGCGMFVDQGSFTGRITRLMEGVATVNAVGVCHACKLITRFHLRLHDDMRLTGLTDQGWTVWKAKPTFTDRVRALVARIFS